MTTDDLTPVEFFGDWCAKREDKACFTSYARPSGSKVRQFAQMIAAQPPKTPMLVGCSAFAAMQIYLADAAEHANTDAHVIVPARKERTAATKWAIAHGAHVDEIRPGYPALYRKRAREKAKALGGCIRWDPRRAVFDAAQQTANLPEGIKRVVVPTASGLIASGVLLGLLTAKRYDVSLACVFVSKLATPESVQRTTAKYLPVEMFSLDNALVKRITLVDIYHPNDYSKPDRHSLPNSEPLDSFYAAKAFPYLRAGDCLWVSGMRPVEINT